MKKISFVLKFFQFSNVAVVTSITHNQADTNCKIKIKKIFRTFQHHIYGLNMSIGLDIAHLPFWNWMRKLSSLPRGRATSLNLFKASLPSVNCFYPALSGSFFFNAQFSLLFFFFCPSRLITSIDGSWLMENR